MRHLRGKLTFANVMAVIAVFLALTGAGYAAFKLPKKSVGTKQIRNGAVTLPKISASAQAALKGTPPAGATSFATPVSVGTAGAELAKVPNGLTIRGTCSSGSIAGLSIQTTSGLNNIQVSGTGNTGSTVFAEDGNGFASVTSPPGAFVDFDVIARDATVGKFAHLDVHGEAASPSCTFWGLIGPPAA